MKSKILSVLLTAAMVVTLLMQCGVIASATTVTDMSEYIIQSATPQTLGRWNGSGFTYEKTSFA